MRITFVTRTFGNVERNSHCDVLHITPIRVARLFLDCNGVFAIKAYWLPVEQRIEYKLLLLTFNCLHGLVGPYLSDLQSRQQPARYALLTLTCWSSRTAIYAGGPTQVHIAFSPAAPRLWNNLPLAMSATDSRTSSRNNLRLFNLNVHFLKRHRHTYSS